MTTHCLLKKIPRAHVSSQRNAKKRRMKNMRDGAERIRTEETGG